MPSGEPLLRELSSAPIDKLALIVLLLFRLTRLQAHAELGQVLMCLKDSNCVLMPLYIGVSVEADHAHRDRPSLALPCRV